MVSKVPDDISSFWCVPRVRLVRGGLRFRDDQKCSPCANGRTELVTWNTYAQIPPGDIRIFAY